MSSLLLSAPLANAAPADLDPSFGLDGKVTLDLDERIGSDNGATGVVLQPDGKLVILGSLFVGSGSEFALARFNPDGSRDTDFGEDGVVMTSFGRFDDARALTLQPDGKLVAVGESDNKFALARYNPDGSLDPSFNGDGKVKTAFGRFADAAAVAVEPDGKVVAAGTASGASGLADFAAARYNPDGSLDRSFGHKGTLKTDFGTKKRLAEDQALGLAIQPNGKLVLAGINDPFTKTAPDQDTSPRLGLVRYKGDGSVDRSFGHHGRVVTRFGARVDVRALALQADGRLVVGGTIGGGHSDFLLIRYKPNGSIDRSFSHNGKVTSGFGPRRRDQLNAIAVQPDGKLVAAGKEKKMIAVARYNPNGSPDRSFGDDGSVITAGDRHLASAGCVVVQPDDKLVVAGRDGESMALLRYEGGGR